jgi:phospholipid/cholesterol/gamma-HCH transport system substrate-binding protein
MRRVVPLLLAGLVVVAIMGGYAFSQLRGSNRLTVILPNAIGLEVGSPVKVKGFDVGKITGLDARDGKAVVEMQVDKLPDPLRVGTTATVAWFSLLGYRYIDLTPGPVQNPVLPDGAMIDSGVPQVTVEELLETLDPPTRVHLSGMLGQLDTTLQGSQPDFNRTLKAAGPTVQALGAVLNGVGADGEAIKALLDNVHKVTQVLAERGPALSATVLDLNRFTSAAAAQQKALGDGLAELPSTLDVVKTTLDKVPPATDATVPLLNDLRPATARLPSVGSHFRSVMHDLGPTLHDLWPTLRHTDSVLHEAPDFLDSANKTVPQLATTFRRLNPAVAFLRPYTPELVGFLGNWGSAFDTYDSSGFFAAPLIVQSPYELDNLPDVTLPGYWPERHVPPGINSGQPWKFPGWNEANGSGPR